MLKNFNSNNNIRSGKMKSNTEYKKNKKSEFGSVLSIPSFPWLEADNVNCAKICSVVDSFLDKLYFNMDM